MSETQGRKAQDVGQDEAWAANIKRTYDVYQDLEIQLARRSLDHYARISVIAERILNNAANADNIANLQAIAHRDIAIDSEWVPGPGEENINND
jgi:hypothetical protein